jgi:hypothetical protein
MKFDTKAEAPKLHFKAMRWLTDDEYAIAAEKGKSPEAINAVALNVSAVDGVKPLDLAGSKPKAAPAVEEEEEAPAPAPKKAAKAKVEEPAEEPAEPAVRKAEAKPSAVPPKKSLADVVSDWDDE